MYMHVYMHVNVLLILVCCIMYVCVFLKYQGVLQHCYNIILLLYNCTVLCICTYYARLRVCECVGAL